MPDSHLPTDVHHFRCCIAGGGPAGMVLAFLLARAGIEVLVLEKHADFLRDFRGDTIHPSTLEVMYELGLLDKFLKRPHQEMPRLQAQVGDARLTVADFSHLPTHCRFIALMPQWDFLNFIAEEGKRYPAFHVEMQAEVLDVIHENGRVAGVIVRTPQGKREVRAELTVGADGRKSVVREKAGLKIVNLGAPIDVLWMRLTKKAGDPETTLGRVDAGKIFVMIDRGDYWQCAYVIPKGRFEDIQRRGLPAFRAELTELSPFLQDRVVELTKWEEIKLLTVLVDRLEKWHRPGLLCIGDAAHAMSPVGGVGINLAIQDAVAAANILAPRFQQNALADEDLAVIQERREFPTRVTQRVQVFVQDNVLSRVLAKRGRLPLPFVMKLLRD